MGSWISQLEEVKCGLSTLFRKSASYLHFALHQLRFKLLQWVVRASLPLQPKNRKIINKSRRYYLSVTLEFVIPRVFSRQFGFSCISGRIHKCKFYVVFEILPDTAKNTTCRPRRSQTRCSEFQLFHLMGATPKFGRKKKNNFLSYYILLSRYNS